MISKKVHSYIDKSLKRVDRASFSCPDQRGETAAFQIPSIEAADEPMVKGRMNTEESDQVSACELSCDEHKQLIRE